MTQPEMSRGDRTRHAIQAATLDLIGAHGVGGVSYRAVAERAGVALGQMTYHYPNRDALLSAAFERHQTELREAATALPIEALAQAPLDDQVEAVVGFLRTMVTTDRSRYLAEFELALEMARDDELRRRLAPSTAATKATALTLLQSVGAADPEIDAIVVSAAIEGLLLRWLSHAGEPDIEESTKAAVGRLLSLVLP